MHFFILFFFYFRSRYLEGFANFSEDDKSEKGKILQCDTQSSLNLKGSWHKEIDPTLIGAYCSLLGFWP